MQINYEEMLAGNCCNLYEYFGCQKSNDEAYFFRVYAPNAKQVAIIGDFNNWNVTKNKLAKIDEIGVWEISISIAAGSRYKYALTTKENQIIEKSDPFSYLCALSPDDSSVVYTRENYNFTKTTLNYPINIYEMHLNGYQGRDGSNNFRNYLFHKKSIDYAKECHFNYVEFMPLTEHHFLGSWGYQPSNFYAPTSRYGEPTELKELVNYAKKQGVNLILDFVLGHFTKNETSLVNFDGTNLYESGYNYQWGVYNFNYASGYVRSFLKSAIIYWFEEFGFDAIRVDALSYIIYHLGNEERPNYAAIEFIKELNLLIKEKYPEKKLMFAEDSSTYSGVTKENGLAFAYKWSLGWMNDLLYYFSVDPLFRNKYFYKLTFSFVYSQNENYVLPVSHDEVVHLKKSLFNKFFGTEEDKFKQIKQFKMHMQAHVGEKLNFMGNEFGAIKEFDENTSLDWKLLENEMHQKIFNFTKKLNSLYLKYPEFESHPYNMEFNFENVDDNVLSYMRHDNNKSTIIIILNTSGKDYDNYLIPLVNNNDAEIILNSEDLEYGGSLKLEKKYHVKNQKINLKLPKFCAIYIRQLKGGK